LLCLYDSVEAATTLKVYVEVLAEEA